MQPTGSLLEIVGVSKRFPGVVALDDVSFDIRPGEVHALIGENGAGKSTLMKIIGGIYQPSDGEIRVDGQARSFPTPHASRDAGIAMVHQEPKLCGALSVAENVLMGALPRRGLVVSWKEANRRTTELMARVGLSIAPTTIADELSIAERQLLQIARALSQTSRLIILDEPTASLTPYEVELLFKVVRGLKAQGVSFIYISHHLDEIFQIADRVTVFKDGRKVAERPTAGTTKDQLVSLMVGRDLGDRFPAKRGAAGEVVLEVEGLKGPGFSDATLQLRRGEVLGIAGLVGAGRTELARVLCGAATAEAGEIRIKGEAVRLRQPGDAISRGLAYIAEDRRDGLFMPLSVRENITIAAPNAVGEKGILVPARQRSVAGAYVERLSVRTPSLEQRIQLLSGGNQQKCILARWLVRGVDILIFDEPTRGIDVGAKSEIYRLIDDFARAGNAVILISSELTEVLGMADRILVMCEGRITGEIPCAEADEARVLALALPHSKSANGTNTASGKLS
jgi:ABC-type sugar transport system ATPase subunit